MLSARIYSRLNQACRGGHRSMSSGSYLIEQEKYSFLKELGLNKENKGVFDGKWSGSGDVSLKKCLFILHIYRLLD